MKLRVALLIAFLALSLGACRREQPAADSAADPASATRPGSEVPAGVGSTMPPYKAQSLSGAEFDLASTRGTVVLINVWATWCPPCRHEIPELIELHTRYAPRGFQVLGASVDGPESVKEVEPMAKRYEINYPVILDTEGKIADILETNVLPTSALLNREGTIVWTRMGTVDADDKELVAAIEDALGR